MGENGSVQSPPNSQTHSGSAYFNYKHLFWWLCRCIGRFQVPDLKDPHVLHSGHRFYNFIVNVAENVNISVVNHLSHSVPTGQTTVISTYHNVATSCWSVSVTKYLVHITIVNTIYTKSITPCIWKFDVHRASIKCIQPINCSDYTPFGPGQTQMLEENSFFEGHTHTGTAWAKNGEISTSNL